MLLAPMLHRYARSTWLNVDIENLNRALESAARPLAAWHPKTISYALTNEPVVSPRVVHDSVPGVRLPSCRSA